MAASFAGPSAGIGSGEGNGRKSSEVLAMVAESLSLHRARGPPSLSLPLLQAPPKLRGRLCDEVRRQLRFQRCAPLFLRSQRPTARLTAFAPPPAVLRVQPRG